MFGKQADKLHDEPVMFYITVIFGGLRNAGVCSFNCMNHK